MNFVHPQFLYLLPLVAIPIVIHLLNRIRYRRVRWAAIEFLMMTQQREIRRARLRQLLLMALRTLLLSAALLALAQPVLSGRLAGILGSSSQVAIVLDASASMTASDATGSAFDRAKALITNTLAALPRSAKATAGTFTANYSSPFREPLLDRRAVSAVVDSARVTAGPGDVCTAVRAAAEVLQRAGGGGTIWLLTDLQAESWRASDAGSYEALTNILKRAGTPRLLITDVGPTVEANLSVAEVRLSPAVPLEGDTPKLTVTVALHGRGPATTTVSLFFDGRRVDSRSVQLTEPGTSDCVFHLPELEAGRHAGYLELSPDALPADDHFFFLLSTTSHTPVLIVEGASGSGAFENGGDFLALAVQPPGSQRQGRSPYEAETIRQSELAAAPLQDYAAVFLSNPTVIEPGAVTALREYVTAGGLLVIFPGTRTGKGFWQALGFAGVALTSTVEAKPGSPISVAWTAPTDPVTERLPVEGLEQVSIRRLCRFELSPDAEVLASTTDGPALLTRTQVGRGKVYAFAVSARPDFSNLPFTPVFLLAVHRIMQTHLIDSSKPLAQTAGTELRISLPPGPHRVLTPGGLARPLTLDPETPGPALFHDTEQAGIYRLIDGTTVPADTDALPPLAAVNVPREESSLDRADRETIRSLLPGYPVSFTRAAGGPEQLEAGPGAQAAASTFPLAAVALLCLLGEVLLAWQMGRPRPGSAEGAAGGAGAPENRRNAATRNQAA